MAAEIYLAKLDGSEIDALVSRKLLSGDIFFKDGLGDQHGNTAFVADDAGLVRLFHGQIKHVSRDEAGKISDVRISVAKHIRWLNEGEHQTIPVYDNDNNQYFMRVKNIGDATVAPLIICNQVISLQ